MNWLTNFRAARKAAQAARRAAKAAVAAEDSLLQLLMKWKQLVIDATSSAEPSIPIGLRLRIVGMVAARAAEAWAVAAEAENHASREYEALYDRLVEMRPYPDARLAQGAATAISDARAATRSPAVLLRGELIEERSLSGCYDALIGAVESAEKASAEAHDSAKAVARVYSRPEASLAAAIAVTKYLASAMAASRVQGACSDLSELLLAAQIDEGTGGSAPR